MKLNKKVLIYLSICLGLSLIVILLTIDFSPNNKYDKINPNSLIYPAKRLTNKISLKLSLSDKQKSEYFINSLNTLLNEILYLIENNKTGFYKESFNRYNSNIQQIINYPEVKNIVANDTRLTKILNTLIENQNKYKFETTNWIYFQQSIELTKTLKGNK